VLRVIEFHIEAFLKTIRKSLAWRIVSVHARVADRAHGSRLRGELGQVTPGAILVTRKRRTCRIVVAMVTIATCY